MATNYDINYNDSRFKEVEADKKAALNEVDVTYGNMISQSDKYYDKQIQASKDWADKQTQLQNQQTDFAIEKIEQQKDQAKKDYTKEQSGAYVDWQKQSNQYGANAEQMAAQGLTSTGFSESSQVSMYNAYQNRVATARESYTRAVLNYDNAIKDARLQNSSVLAEIAYKALEQQLQLSLEGFQYKNQLLIEQSNKKMALDSEYHNRYLDVLNQINHENALAEEVRVNDAAIAHQKAQEEIQRAQLAEEKRQFNILHPANTGGKIKKGSSGSKGVVSSSKPKATLSGGVAKDGPTARATLKDDGDSGNSVDMNSVLSLGYGPISAARAYQLVQQGLATTYTKNGKTYFKKSAYANKQNTLYKSLLR